MLIEEIEQSQSDGTEQASSEPESPAPAQEKEHAAKPAESSKPKEESTEESVPFHKHPRWIERDNELKQERQERQRLQDQYQQMQKDMQQLREPKTPDKRAAMLEKLKGIDPEFADLISNLAPASDLEELRAWKAQQESQDLRRQALSELDRLHQQHKIDDATKARYNVAIEAKVRQNPNLRVSDLAAVYNEVHSDYSQWLDSIRRAERESYVKAKTAAASAPPSQPRGAPVNPGKGKPEWSKDPEKARSELISRTLSKARANSDI